MTLLLRRDRPRIARSNVQLTYLEAAAESERVVAWVDGRIRRARPRKVALVAADCLPALDATLAQLYAALRPANFPEREHGELVDALRRLLNKLVSYVDRDDGRGVKADIRAEQAAFTSAFAALRASGLFDAAPSTENPA
jgi:hypothetical protein